MRAAWYEKQGPARQVLIVGEMPDPHPGPGEFRIRIAASGINPGDTKKRQDVFGYGMPYPRVIPHSDGAGEVDEVGGNVSPEWLGKAVWCFGAQSYRPFGTAAEFTVVPVDQIAPLPQGIAWNRAPVSGYRASPRTGRSMWRATSAGGPCSCRARPAQLAFVQFSSRFAPAPGWWVPFGPRARKRPPAGLVLTK